MPTPILQVPIDDKAFKSFLELFNKYKGDVARLPELWKGTNEEIIAQISSANSVVEAIDKQTSALLLQQEVLHKSTQELEKQAKIETAREKAETRERKDKEKADKKAIEDTKKIANNIAKATVNIIKWGALDVLVAGAADLWGLGAISRNVGDQLSAARGVNVTIGQRQALAQTFQPIFDTTNALEKAAEAQTDVTKSIPYRILGLNPNAENPAELSIDAALAAKRRLQGVPQQSQLLVAHALGLDQIFSDDELRRILNTPQGFLETEKSGGRLPNGQVILGYEQLQKRLDLPTDVAQEYTALSQQLSIAGREIEIHFARKLIELGPGLDKLITSFVTLADNLIDLVDWKNLGTNLQNFAMGVEHTIKDIDWGIVKEDLQKFAIGMQTLIEKVPWDEVWKDMVEFAVGVDAALNILSKIPGIGRVIASAAGVFTGAPVVTGAAVGAAIGNTAAGIPLGADYSLGANLADRAAAIRDKLAKDLRITPDQAAGIVSNLQFESGLRGIEEDPKLGAAHGQFGHDLDLGWAQWHGARRYALEAYAAAHHLDVHSDAANYGFLVQDIREHYQGLLARMRKDPRGAALDFYDYESGGSPALEYMRGMHARYANSIARATNKSVRVNVTTTVHVPPGHSATTSAAQVSQ